VLSTEPPQSLLRLRPRAASSGARRKLSTGRPSIRQVWAVPTTLMQCGWLGERVATVDLPRAIANVVHGREDAGWGPNAVFRFPKRGGTGAVWRAVAALLPDERQVGGQAAAGRLAG
jgi:hypothetical protein